MSYDPRKPRKNTELSHILRCVKTTHTRFQNAPNHSQRRGEAMTLIAHLQMFLEEPEFHQDLRPDQVEAGKLLQGEEFEKAASLTGEWPFERSGTPGDDLFFFYTSTRYVSQLYSGQPVDPYQVGPLWSHGPYTYSFRFLYGTSGETRNHLSDPTLLGRLVKQPKGKKAPFWLFIDPRGVYGGGTELARTYSSEAAAIKAADRLSAQLEIRFFVARVEMSNCTR